MQVKTTMAGALEMVSSLAEAWTMQGAVVAGTELGEGGVVGAVVVDACGQVGEVAGDEVEVDVIEGASAGGGAEVYLSTTVVALAGDASGVVEQGGEGCKAGGQVALDGVAGGGYGLEAGHGGTGDFAGERYALAVLVNLEGQGLVHPVEEVGTGAHALIGVLGLVVVGADEGGIPVGHGVVPFDDRPCLGCAGGYGILPS